jgi:hypothetical protein
VRLTVLEKVFHYSVLQDALCAPLAPRSIKQHPDELDFHQAGGPNWTITQLASSKGLLVYLYTNPQLV